MVTSFQCTSGFKRHESQVATKKERSVCIVGPLPEPIGGVSSHIARLAAFLVAHKMRCSIIDAYPSGKKVAVRGVEHHVTDSLGSPLGIPRFLYALSRMRCDVVHFHYSRISGWFLLVLLMLKQERAFVLTLHHGDQAGVFENARWPTRFLAARALRRMDIIVTLSEEQAAFYRTLGVAPGRLSRWSVALPLNISPDASLLPESLQELRAFEDGGDETLLMTSGYPTESYRYEYCLELLDSLSSTSSCRLIVSLYGKASNAGYADALRRRLAEHPRVILVDPLPAAAFLALLAKASLYLRPSTIDSYGLVITDAIDVGTPCLASDICDRDPRCDTFPVANKQSFMSQALEFVAYGRRERSCTAGGEFDSSASEEIVRCYQRHPATSL